ncbi:hypothetical protein QVD17_39423 [Tagetes erecta]|uniref:Uncharacterized protein n=1 Tax=Tagetes erecta TaxID=13708 RepID=A0AAD8JQD3_TARER|nr:hypothetical protein QVD17_39423 [Tagetes erecta]
MVLHIAVAIQILELAGGLFYLRNLSCVPSIIPTPIYFSLSHHSVYHLLQAVDDLLPTLPQQALEQSIFKGGYRLLFSMVQKMKSPPCFR